MKVVLACARQHSTFQLRSGGQEIDAENEGCWFVLSRGIKTGQAPGVDELVCGSDVAVHEICT